MSIITGLSISALIFLIPFLIGLLFALMDSRGHLLLGIGSISLTAGIMISLINVTGLVFMALGAFILGMDFFYKNN